MTTTTNDICRVVLATAYLREQMEKDYSEEYVAKQREKFGYNPNNFATVNMVEAGRFCVELLKERSDVDTRPHLIIAGATEPQEELTESLKGSGLIVARYSVFYGGPSNYTGKYPDEAGYALDIPKNMDAVRALLSDEACIEALLLREESKISTSMNALNKKLAQPVIVTPYLTQALRG